jgi:hypothetical protein
MVESAIESLMRSFSSCLALQERKEKEYVDMVTKSFKERLFPSIKKNVEPFGELNEQQKAAVSAGVVGVVLGPLVFHDKRQKRASPIAKMEGEILFGTNHTPDRVGGIMGEIRKALAYINGFDLNQHTDREALRRVEKSALLHASRRAGVSLPPMPELG